jgi:hypothetical protein
MRRISLVPFFLLMICWAHAINYYPISPSPSGRFMVDSNGAPFIIIGDSPHSLSVNLNSSNVQYYCTNRCTNGFNTILVECLCDSYTGGYGNEGNSGNGGNANYGSNIYGANPFNATLSGGYYDLTQPNPAYWTNIDWIVAAAGSNGLQVMLVTLDQGGWTDTSLANGSNGCYTYGQFLGNRYAASSNLCWCMGNDFQNYASEPTNNWVIVGLARGILSKDTNHFITTELNYWNSYGYQDQQLSPYMNVDGVYTYYSPYSESYLSYVVSNQPSMVIEDNYEGEDNDGNQPQTPLSLREQAWWATCYGSLGGTLYGNHYIWGFLSGWQNNLSTTGTTNLLYFKEFFTNIAFQTLVPDVNNIFVTGGYGTSNFTEAFSTGTYVTAAYNSAGTLGVAYVPNGATLTVAMSVFSKTMTAQWFDPSAGTYSTINGSPFANTGTQSLATPGNNAGGTQDWVLLLTSSIPTNYVNTTGPLKFSGPLLFSP